MRLSDRLGGHMVQGHVDGVGTVRGVAADGFSRRVEIEAGDEILRYVVHKGSITVDGVSLTVAGLGRRIVYRFSDPRDAGTDQSRPRRGRDHREPGGGCVGQIRREAGGKRAMSSTKSAFATIEEAIEDIRQGKMVVVCDDENRENEGDLTMAAQFVTPEAINFMRKEGGGLICLAPHPRALRRARPGPDGGQERVRVRDGVHGVDRGALGRVSTGISAADRARTIQVAIDPKSSPRELVQPGSRVPAQGQGRRRARARRPDRGRGRPGQARGPEPVQRDLRDHERGRDDGPGAGPRRDTASATA